MPKEDKIKAIYEKIANKTLSFGCQVLDNSGLQYGLDTGYAHIYISRYYEKIINVIECSSGRPMRLYEGLGDMDNLGKIIGHPVMIGDVFDWQIKNSKHSNITEERLKIIGLWNKLRLPIEEQSNKCINYVYNLL